MTLSTGTLVRTSGVAVAGMLSSRTMRAVVLAGSYGAGWVTGPHGIQLLSVSGIESDNPVVREGVPLLTATASWTGSQLAALAALRALPLPRVLTVPAYAALLAVAEGRVVASLEQAKAAGTGQGQTP